MLRGVQVYEGDLTVPGQELGRFVDGVDVLYHCAGEVSDLSRMRAVHVGGTQNLVAGATGRIGHWVQLSSVGAYGTQQQGIITEETPLRPVGIYEESKTESDRLVMQAADEGAFTFTVLRPSNVYGPSMRNRSLFQLIAMINRRLFFFVGKPGASANYIHVDNVSEALYRCGIMEAAKGQVYNLSDYCTLEEFVGVIAGELQVSPPRNRVPEMPTRLVVKCLGRLPGFPLTEARLNALVNRTTYAIDRIQQDLEYRHIVSVEEGLRELVEAWRQRRQENDSAWSYPAH